MKSFRLSILLIALVVFALLPDAAGEEITRYWITVPAANREERSALANLGLAIEEINANSVSGSCDQATLDKIKAKGITPQSTLPLEEAVLKIFPPQDAEFHDYAETEAALKELAAAEPELVSLFSAGTTWEGRSLWTLRLNTTAKGKSPSDKPGAIFMGTHHAREHLSNEIPLLLAQYLVSQYRQNAEIRRLLETRDIYILPMVNPDGAEYDIHQHKPGENTRRYLWWRKNRRDNGRSYGVDLNRNYGYKWNTGGSSDHPASDVYHGPGPFSEPETQAIKKLIEENSNIRVLLSFHTFSELILYPWGHKYDPISNKKDLAVFKKMAQTMAQFNGYKPQQSSQLYIASGDTTDWAYGEKGIFAFTFELTPKNMWAGGFYPGPQVIQSTFKANLPACLYLIKTAENPYAVLDTEQRTALKPMPAASPRKFNIPILKKLFENR